MQQDNLVLRIAEAKHELQALQRAQGEIGFSEISTLASENSQLTLRLREREREHSARAEELETLRGQVAALVEETGDKKRFLDAVSKKLRQTVGM